MKTQIIASIVPVLFVLTRAQCPKNEVFLECGTACEPTCENPKPQVCTEQCVAGCFCQEGYIRDGPRGTCVRSCEIKCPEGEVFLECGKGCEPTCQNEKPENCTDYCVAQCVCPEGYIREGPGGRCVRSCEGVPICKENEVFSSCLGCPKSCNKSAIVRCPPECTSGCECREYYVRVSPFEEKCIPEVSCKTKCEENEYYSECGTLCPGTCSEPFKVCNKECANGCFCKEGYILDDATRKCIREGECPK